MKLSELFLNRYLYKDNNQSMETKDSVFNSIDNSDTEPASIPAGGSAQDINTGNVQIDGGQLEPGTYPVTTLDVSNWGWGQTCVFSSTDLNTVSWLAGTFTSANGVSYSIGANNTGNMAAKTYIYLDVNVSITEYQKTTTSSTSVGVGKVLIAVAENDTTDATYNLQEANQIVADNILANTIDASKMNVGQLSAISANIGDITAGTITGLTITGGTIQTAASGKRFVIAATNTQWNGYNANGDSIGKLDWDDNSAAILKLSPAYNARRALEISIPASFTSGAESAANAITIANLADSISIDITDGGLVGLEIAACDTSAIKLKNNSTNAALIDLTGADSGTHPIIDMVQNGASANSYGIRIVQGTASLKEAIYIDDNANSSSSESIYVDRDSNSASESAAVKIDSHNAGAGDGLGMSITAGDTGMKITTPAGGLGLSINSSTTGVGIDITNAGTGIDLSACETYHMKIASDSNGIGGLAGRIPIDVGGVVKYIPYYDAP